jgi:hypothetical protein
MDLIKSAGHYCSAVSSFGFLSTFNDSASSSALRLPAPESSGAFFFFLTTIDVKSFTTVVVAVFEEDDPAFSSRSRA